jgi:hypothetical protein
MDKNALILLEKMREQKNNGVLAPGYAKNYHAEVAFFVYNKVEGDNAKILQYLMDFGVFSADPQETLLDAASRASDP